MSWLLPVLELLKKVLPAVINRAKGNGTETLPTVRRIEHDVDRMREQLNLIVKDQGTIVSQLHRIEQIVDRD